MPSHWKINEGEQFYSDESGSEGDDDDEEDEKEDSKKVDVNMI